MVVLSGRHQHSRQVLQRIGVITILSRVSASPLSEAQLHQLWTCTVVNHVSSLDTTTMFRFCVAALPIEVLHAATTMDWPASLTISQAATHHLLQTLLPSLADRPSHFNADAFHLTVHVMLCCATLSGSISFNEGVPLSSASPLKSPSVSPSRTQAVPISDPTSIRVNTSASIIGSHELWYMLLRCDDDTLATEIALWLVSLFAGSHLSLRDQGSTRQSLVDVCMTELRDTSSASPLHTRRVLQLLAMFVSECEAYETDDSAVPAHSLSPAIHRLVETLPPTTPGKVTSASASRASNTPHQPQPLVRQFSRSSADFASDDEQAASLSGADDAVSTPTVPASEQPADGQMLLRCTVIDNNGKSSSLLLDIAADATVSELRMVCACVTVVFFVWLRVMGFPFVSFLQLIASKAGVSDALIRIRHAGSELDQSDSSSLLHQVAICHGARIIATVADEDTNAPEPPAAGDDTTTTTLDEAVSEQVTPTVTPQRVQRQASDVSSASSYERRRQLSSMPVSPTPKSVSQIIQASRTGSPSRLRSPAKLIDDEYASTTSSMLTPIRHASSKFNFDDAAPTVSASITSRPSAANGPAAEGIASIHSGQDRRKVNLQGALTPVLTPSQVAVVLSVPSSPLSRRAITTDINVFPSALLARNTLHFALLLSLLELPPPVCDDAWKVVATLPPNASASLAVEQLASVDKTQFSIQWSSLFGSSGYKMLYSLILLERTLLLPSTPAGPESTLRKPVLATRWSEAFVSKGGLLAMQSTFVTLVHSVCSSPLLRTTYPIQQSLSRLVR